MNCSVIASLHGSDLKVKLLGDKQRKWRKKKLASLRVADAYAYLKFNVKALRCRDCGSLLEFEECTQDGFRRLVAANFCKLRLCPTCSWRRSLRLAMEATRLLHAAVEKYPEWQFILLTVTQRNVSPKNLYKEISKIFKGWKRLSDRKDFSSIKGYLRVLEITHNDSTGEWHPHLHCLLFVPPSYFTHGYVSQERWSNLWRQCLGLDYDPVVWVSKVRNQKGAAQEVGKYTVKQSDVIGRNRNEDVERVRVLDKALHGRRLFSLGGVLREIAKEIKTELEPKDLVNVQTESCPTPSCPICGSGLVKSIYAWIDSLRDYVLFENHKN